MLDISLIISPARARGLMRVEDNGEIMFLTKNGVIPLTQENCWEVVSKNTWGISGRDYKDLTMLIQ